MPDQLGWLPDLWAALADTAGALLLGVACGFGGGAVLVLVAFGLLWLGSRVRR